jgi:hypothetical protein
MGAYNKEMKRYDPERAPEMRVRDYLRSVTTPRPTLLERVSKKHFWEMRIKWWKLSGRLATLGPSLSVGPRWLTEIRYFRDIVGLRDHIGLDLFSDNPEMVVAGDMHAMPFSESHFRLVFLKNVVDKSYDIRTLVDELIRVTRDKGIVIVDQICGYHGCNPLGRTDIQSAGNLLRVFQARVHVDTLVKQDIDVTGLGDAAGSNARRNNARLALQLHKGPASR